MFRSVFVPAIVASLLLAGSLETHAEEVEEGQSPLLTEESFTLAVAEKPHFVMFFAPWCGHCKKLAPVWQEMHEKLGGFAAAGATDDEESAAVDVGVARVDCTDQTALCTQHKVTGYPTLKFFPKGSEEGVRYKGARGLDDLITFIKVELGLIVVEEPEPEEAPKPTLPVMYDSESFETAIATGHHFIKFFAPWCGHCQRLAPVWSKLAESFASTPRITIGKMDCTQNKETCSKYGVRGYPTLMWFTDGEKVGEKYAGDRSLDAMRTYALEQAKKPSKPIDIPEAKTDTAEAPASTPSAPVSQSSVLSLNEDNFQQTVDQGVTLVKFFAPWCGHCKKMAGAYEELGAQFSGHELITIAEVDCTAPGNRELCTQQEVKGFPTILAYRAGSRVSSYEGDRSTPDMAQFVTGQLKHDEL